MTQPKGILFASRADSPVGQGIRMAEEAREKRIHHFNKDDYFYNHIS